MNPTKIILFFVLASNLCYAQSTIDTCRMKMGINFTTIGYTNVQQPFVDLMKTCDMWSTQDTSGFPIATNTNELSSIPVDTNGYPLQLPVTVSGQPRTVFTKMVSGINGYYPGGNYVVLYDGTGTFRFSGSSISIVSSVPGRIEIDVTPNNTGIYLKLVTSDVSDPVRNIRVLMPGHELTYQSQPFNPEFTSKIAPFTTLRFMDWNNNNTNEDVQWSNRRSSTYYTQGSSPGRLDSLGVAWEYAINLCNSLGKDCWISVPTMADDNYITQLATLFRDSLDPNLKIYLEYSNECWNMGSAFLTNYNWIEANGTGANHSQKTASLICNVFDLWQTVFGTSMSTRVIRVATGRLTSTNSEVQIIMDYLIANCTGADAISVSAYNLWPLPDYDSLIALCPTATVADIISINQNRMATYYPWFVNITQKSITYGIPLLFYEGGQHIQGSGAPCAMAAIYDAQNDIGMYNFYQTWFQKLRDTTNATLFMHFALAGVGTMGLLNHIYQPTSLKYQAITEYINNCQDTMSSAVENYFETGSLVVFPNPTYNFITILGKYLANENYQITLTSLMGQIFSQKKLKVKDKTFEAMIDLSALSPGIYFIAITSAKTSHVFKIIKQ